MSSGLLHSSTLLLSSYLLFIEKCIGHVLQTTLAKACRVLKRKAKK